MAPFSTNSCQPVFLLRRCLWSLLHFVKHRGMRAIVEWAPRECNKEADMLANGDSSLFERRIPVAAGTLVWNVLPEALKAGRDAEETFKRLKETHACPTGQPSRGSGQRNIDLSSRTPGSGIGSDRHPYISITLLCSPSVLVPFSAFLFSGRLVSFPFHLPYAFLVFAFIYLLFSFSSELDLLRALFLAWVIFYWRIYLCFGFFCGLQFSSCFLFGGYFICLVLLSLGLMSAKSHPHDQLIRAELSSKSSSEPLSESLSKLSSHQIPRCLRVHYS